jgi:hypothetical protein
MKYEIEALNSFCSLDTFTINGIEADEDYFVYGSDEGDREEYGCGNRVARVIKPNQYVLKAYKITEEEFYVIANEIAEALSFGQCSWCV